MVEQIIIAGVIYGHVASKYIYIRVFGARELKNRTPAAFIKWAVLTFILWAIAWIIAQRFTFPYFLLPSCLFLLLTSP